ncbi:hypothetical protein [Streptomyces hainanensis]|uniref:Uncharacterized protein n=1 Tax=Streptomyces hainanensis TaxID=402648 RepID=A0A4R4TU06_9ACTN|nr:hypothetical protein [Streptomyces hainanensis]TDC78633.1 hypothetical protein E1283_04570 [Streptomyces hainanensis]
MRNRVVRNVGRWAIAGAGVATVTGLGADVARADGSLNAPGFALINIGQIDDPMEDVLEHTLNFGDGYRWD